MRSPLSQELDRVLGKLLQKDQERRYQSAVEVLKDLNPPPPPRPPVPPTVLPPPQPSPPRPPVPPTVPPHRQSSSSPPIGSAKHKGKFKNTLLVGGAILLLGLGGYGFWYITTHPPAETIAYEKLALANTLTGHSGSVKSVAISPDGQTLVSGSSDNTIKIWNLSTGTLRTTLTGHSGFLGVNSVAISPDGQTLVSGSGDNTIKVWRVAK